MLPDVSVVITCYNYGRYLERCLRSVYNQEHTKRFSYEIIIVNDCSIDNTESIIRQFESKFDNLIYIYNIKNQGISRSCNSAIQSSNGRYIVRIDADDYVSRHFLFLLKFALDKNRRYQAFCCDYIEVDDFENNLRFVSPTEEQIACAVMYRKEYMIDVGLYDEEFEYREGHELNKRFRDKYEIGHLPIPLYFARKHDNNRSGNIEKISEYDQKLSLDKQENP
jgi:glycosyltransferase involved in cell wall biosynthesis